MSDNLLYRIIDDERAEVIGVRDKSISMGVVEIPERYEGRKITCIKDSAFKDIDSLTDIALPISLEEIGTCAFSGCKNLEEVVMPDTLKKIGLLAFFHCTCLENIFIPESVNYIDKSAFHGANQLKGIYCSPKNKFFSSADGVLFSKDFKELLIYPEGKKESHYSIPRGTEAIGEEAFSGSEYLKSILLSNSVKEIKRCAFDGCRELEEVTFNEGLERIGRWAFRYSEIKNLHIPSTLSLIEEEAFFSSKLSSITANDNPHYTVKDGVLFQEGDKLFLAPPNIHGDYSIPEGTEVVCKSAFSSCSLKRIIMPSTLRVIEENAFSDCRELEEAIIPEGVEYIGRGAYENCHKLSKVSIPESITTLPDDVFKMCWNLKEVILPSSLIAIGAGSFSECRELIEVDIPESVRIIGAGAFSGSSINSITLPSSIRRIGCWAFSHCNNLIEITAPEKVTRIEHNTFRRCISLKRIALGEGIEEIDPSAFEECPELEEIIIHKSKSSIDINKLIIPETCSIIWNN